MEKSGKTNINKYPNRWFYIRVDGISEKIGRTTVSKCEFYRLGSSGVIVMTCCNITLI